MPTFTALTTLEGADRANALGEALEALMPEPTGVGVFEVEDDSGIWEVGAYFTEEPDQAGLAILATMHEAKPFVVSEVPDQDWVAKVRRELAPVEAGRFFVYGSHDADKVPDGSIPLLIEAAMAFGTGHHGTTLGCLLAFDRLIDEGFVPQNAIDVGCGTAVLAMAAAHVSPNTVLASDIDPVAIDVADANAEANGLRDRIVTKVAVGLDDDDLKAAAPFDLIFANILKGPLILLAPSICAATADNGYVILSGILNEQANEVADVYTRNGFNVIQRDSIVDWTTLTLCKLSS